MMRVEKIMLYDAEDPMKCLHVEDHGDCFELVINDTHGKPLSVRLKKDSTPILASFLRNRVAVMKPPEGTVH